LSAEDALNATLAHAEQLVADGADILDIGGESTRPGAAPVSLDEELRRVLPVVEALATRVAVPISVDTTKSGVARACLQAGASIINDISGATFDSQMLETLAANDCGIVLMHLRGTPQTMGWSSRTRNTERGTRSEEEAARSREEAAQPETPTPEPDDVIAEVTDFWRERIAACEAAGIARGRIALDAGFGFGKSVEENLELLRRGRELADFGFPTLSGTSRKSTIGKILSDAPVEQRVWGTAATVAIAIANGCAMVRVHDVREISQVARMADAVVRPQQAARPPARPPQT
jgi:dihydropteroate synthase